MDMTLGKRIAQLRRQKGIKQEELASMLGISAQAVSKWENDQTCPDVMSLPKIAKILGTTVDYLLCGAEEPVAQIVPAEKRKELKDMMLRVVVDSPRGDKVRVNLPMALVQVAVDSGIQVSAFTGNPAMDAIDLRKIMELVSQGVIGNLVEVESAEGETVRIFVE